MATKEEEEEARRKESVKNTAGSLLSRGGKILKKGVSAAVEGVSAISNPAMYAGGKLAGEGVSLFTDMVDADMEERSLAEKEAADKQRFADNKAAGGSTMFNTVMDGAVSGIETVSNAKPKVDVIDYTDAPMEGPENQKAKTFLDERYSPEKMGGKTTIIGDEKFTREASNRENMAQNFFDQNQQLEARKGFAADLYKNKFNPETASKEDRKNYFERGESMGLSPQQMDKYTQSYLNPEEPATQGGSGQGRMPEQGASQQVKQTAAGVAGTRNDAGPTLQTGSLRDGPRQIGTEGGRLRRMSRRARRDGQTKVASELYGASMESDLNTPAIRSQGYRYAQGQRREQLSADQAQEEAMKRKVIDDVLKRPRRDAGTPTNTPFEPTRYYQSS